MVNRKNWIWWLLSVVGLSLSYILCRFVFLNVHGMKDWPTALAIAIFIVLTIALISQKRVIAVMSVAGYLAGFAVGAIFSSDSLDAGGGTINNYWIIWTSVIVVSITAGIFIEFLIKRFSAGRLHKRQ